MRRLFIVITFTVFAKTFFAQKMDSVNYRKNAISAEGLGNAFIYSFNYERLISEDQQGFFSLRIGLGVGNGTLSPILINHIFTMNRYNHCEIGAGIALGTRTDSKTKNIYIDIPYATANLMYRYQKPRGHFIFRAGWTPIYQFKQGGVDIITFLYLIFPGVSVGYTF